MDDTQNESGAFKATPFVHGDKGERIRIAFETGDTLACQWGYSMQLVTFYRVLRGASVGSYAMIQKIPQKIVTHDGYGQAGKVTADLEAEPTEKPEKRKVQAANGFNRGIWLKSDAGYCYLWSGQPLNFDTYD